MNTSFIQVITAIHSRELASAIAHDVVSRRLAASAQVSGPIQSTYWWKGKMETTEEWLCTMRTRCDLYQELENAIRQLHPYEEPGIIVLPIIGGSPSYLTWIQNETQRKETQES